MRNVGDIVAANDTAGHLICFAFLSFLFENNN